MLPVGKDRDRFKYPHSKGRTRFWPDENRVTARGLLRDTFFWLRSIGLACVLMILWPALDPALVEPPAFLSTEPETVDATFVPCGAAPTACVVDGDTFGVGDRRIRIIGIDTPETHPSRCAEEARLGEQATVRLQNWLNDGPFEMVGRYDDLRDRYDRELRVVRRRQADGSFASAAQAMREVGLARRYLGGFRRGWC